MHAQPDARGGGLAGVGVVCVCVCRLLTGRRGVCGVFVGASVCAGWAAAWLRSGAACCVGSCAAGYSYAAGSACTAGRMLAPVLQTLAGTLPYMCLLWKCVFPGADWRGGGVVCVVRLLYFFFGGGCAGPVVMAGRCCAAELRETADDLGKFVGNMSNALLVLAGETATLTCVCGLDERPPHI